MADNGLGAMEARFADMIWESEPVGSTELVRRAAAELGWKKSTTYTVLKRLAERGLFVNEDGVVRAMVKAVFSDDASYTLDTVYQTAP